MTTEELLNPRYRVIADYPQALWDVGTIIPTEFHSIKNLSKEMIAFYDKYPHLFKKLEWWEERSHAELPKYIAWYDPTDKTEFLPKYFEVLGWGTSHNTANIVRCHTKDGFFFISDCKPATKEDYEKFNNQQTVKVCDATKDDSSNTAK